jgi:Zn-dependent protease with chaperone function
MANFSQGTKKDAIINATAYTIVTVAVLVIVRYLLGEPLGFTGLSVTAGVLWAVNLLVQFYYKKSQERKA